MIKRYKLTLLNKDVEIGSTSQLSLSQSLVLVKEYLNNYDDLSIVLDLIK